MYRIKDLPLDQRRLVIYSEGSDSWTHFESIVERLLEFGGGAFGSINQSISLYQDKMPANTLYPREATQANACRTQFNASGSHTSKCLQDGQQGGEESTVANQAGGRH